jgi:hypothetical protein
MTRLLLDNVLPDSPESRKIDLMISSSVSYGTDIGQHLSILNREIVQYICPTRCIHISKPHLVFSSRRAIMDAAAAQVCGSYWDNWVGRIAVSRMRFR